MALEVMLESTKNDSNRNDESDTMSVHSLAKELRLYYCELRDVLFLSNCLIHIDSKVLVNNRFRTFGLFMVGCFTFSFNDFADLIVTSVWTFRLRVWFLSRANIFPVVFTIPFRSIIDKGIAI